MTRTRTQSALTKLVEMVANVHGELAFLEGLLLAEEVAGRRGKMAALTDEQRKGLAARHSALLGQREALYATVKQFDPRANSRGHRGPGRMEKGAWAELQQSSPAAALPGCCPGMLMR